MRKTKIICTLGPASSTYEVLLAMAKEGMNVARINMSHGTKEEHRQKIDLIKRIRKELDIALPVMIDGSAYQNLQKRQSSVKGGTDLHLHPRGRGGGRA